MCKRWFLYDERQWLLFIISNAEETIVRCKKQLADINIRIARWENYLRTGK